MFREYIGRHGLRAAVVQTNQVSSDLLVQPPHADSMGLFNVTKGRGRPRPHYPGSSRVVLV